MKYLKTYKIFESVDYIDSILPEIEDISLEIQDEGFDIDIKRPHNFPTKDKSNSTIIFDFSKKLFNIGTFFNSDGFIRLWEYLKDNGFSQYYIEGDLGGGHSLSSAGSGGQSIEELQKWSDYYADGINIEFHKTNSNYHVIWEEGNEEDVDYQWDAGITPRDGVVNREEAVEYLSKMLKTSKIQKSLHPLSVIDKGKFSIVTDKQYWDKQR